MERAMGTKTDTRIKELMQEVIAKIHDGLEETGSYNLYLFGSRAKGTAKDHADIDLALELFPSNDDFKKIRREIDEIETLFSIDLIDMTCVDDGFKEVIMSTGKKIRSNVEGN
jgi:uncharacterized protein